MAKDLFEVGTAVEAQAVSESTDAALFLSYSSILRFSTLHLTPHSHWNNKIGEYANSLLC